MDNNVHAVSDNNAAGRNPLYTDEVIEIDSEETWSMEEDYSDYSLDELIDSACDDCTGCVCCMPDEYGFVDGDYWDDLAAALLVESTPTPPQDNNSLDCPSAPRKPPSYNVWTNSWDYTPPSPSAYDRIYTREQAPTEHVEEPPVEEDTFAIWQYVPKTAKRPRPDPSAFDEDMVQGRNKFRRIE